MASLIGRQSGTAAVIMARMGGTNASPKRLIAIVLLVALLTGALGVAIYRRADIADLVSRASKVLEETASAVGALPIAKSLAALLDQRSPGERTSGELANDKQRFAARPQQRALGKVRPALPAPFVKALTTPIPDVVPQPFPVANLNSPLLPNVLPAPGLGSIPAVFVGPGGGGVGPGGGGPGPGGGGPPGVEVPPVVSPVPEPASWLTMILGFYILARSLQRQRLAKARGAAVPA